MLFLLRLIQRFLGPIIFLAFIRSVFRDLGRFTYNDRRYGGNNSYGNRGGSYYGGNYGGYGSGGNTSYNSGDQGSSGSYYTGGGTASPYEVFGLPRSATNDQIRSKYRELVSKYHPDKFASMNDPQFSQLAAKKFQQIQDAYDQLKRERGM